MGKLCIIDVIAPLYRKKIFQLLDSEYKCVWLFGKAREGIKELDWRTLSNVQEAKNIKLFGPIYYQKNCLKTFFHKDITAFLVNGEPYCLSSWLITLFALFSSHKKVYFWSHGWYGKEGFLKRLIKKLYFKLPTGSFIYGSYAKDLMVKEGIAENKIFVIHNSLDYDNQIRIREKLHETKIYEDHFHNKNNNLIFIGRLTPVKQLDLVIKAIDLLKNKGLSINLTFVGDGSEKEKLSALTRDLNLESQVWFYGACYDEDINAELIFNSDLCVAPGNVGLTAIHCMTFGTPVITHNDFSLQMPEFESIKENQTGGFFLPNDVKSMSDCIESWLLSHTNRNEVREACYKEIDSYWTPDFQMEVFKKNLIIE